MFRHPLGDGAELRLLEPRHAEEIYAAVDASRERLRQWLPWVDGSRSVDDTRAFLRDQLQKLGRQESMTAGIFQDGRFAGAVEARLDWQFQAADLGYWIVREFEGRGLMTRACRELLRYVFDELRFHRATIRCAVENRRSCSVAERLDFELEGVLREVMEVGGRRQDMRLYALLASDRR